MTIQNLLKIASKNLKEITDIPYKEAQILLSFLLKKDRLWISLNQDYIINNKAIDGFFMLIDRRINFEPIEYITGEVSFFSESFEICNGVLIPRPETELLIEHTLEIIKQFENPTIAEIGTGSGVISIILKKMYPNIKIIATDINPIAIELAKKNAKKFNLDIKFILTNLIDNIKEKIDIIVSNPPYIKNEYNLPKSVTFEPQNALFGGFNGDEILKQIIDISIQKKVKYLCCEMGYDQKDTISQYLISNNLTNFTFFNDYSEFDRGFIVKVNE